jgi:phage terminase large subunit
VAYKKPVARSAEEWKAFKHWLKEPVDGVKSLFNVTPDDWQGDLLNGLFRGEIDRAAYKSAHGTGKTTVDAWAGWLFLNAYENCRVVATAPTIHQLVDALWPEYAKWHGNMPSRVKDEWIISGTHIRHKISPLTWFATARTSNKPANLQGFHNENLLIQGDEGSAIPDPVFEVIEGALSEAGDEGKIAKLMLGGNPNFTSGELFNAFGRNQELYHRVTITGDPEWFESLNIEQGGYHPQHGYVYLSARVRKRYRETMAKKYGLDSAVYDVRVRGIFPRAAEDVVIPWEWAERAQEMEMPTIFDGIADPVTIVIDPSRGGGAETVIGIFRRGYCLKLHPMKVTSTTQIVNKVHEIVLKLQGKHIGLATIIVDEPGIGGGVIDQLRAKNLPVTPYNGGRGMKPNVDPAEDCRMFANRRARDWWHLRRRLETNSLPLPRDGAGDVTTLIGQLTCLKFHYNQQEKIVVESKEDLKDRLGKEASPDRADVIVMGTAPWYGEAVADTLSEEDILFGDDRPQLELWA